MRVLVVGAGGHARVVLDILGQLSHEVVGIIDDDLSKSGKSVGGYSVIGTTQGLAGLLKKADATGAIVAIGDNDSRLRVASNLAQLGYEFITAVHPAAVVGSRVKVGAGSVVMAGAVVNCDTHVGDHVVINTGATVDHDCWVSDGCHISPGAHLAGGVHLANRVHIGIGASIVPNVAVGEASVVGAGSVVLRDIPARERWVGNPARRPESGNS